MSGANFPEWSLVVAVAVGGAMGTLLRYLAGFYFGQWFGTSFPWATLFVNVAGGLIIGVVATLTLEKPGVMGPVARLFLTTGFCGGFTTFSTFSFETLSFFQRGETAFAFANIGSNVVISLAATFVGIILARLL
jgi:fluoride exporter